MSRTADARIVAPAWYAENLGAGFVAHEELISEALPSWLAAACLRAPVLRGAALALLGMRRGGLAVIKGLPGTATALAVAALSGRRCIIVLEFICRPPSRNAYRRLAYGAWRRLLEAPALRRAMAAGQVLTEWERAAYASRYRLPEERFRLVRWPLCRWGGVPAAEVAESGTRVISSGRAHSDWRTLFTAAEGAHWDLTVVCGDADRALVEELNRDGRARVRTELSRQDHDALLREGDVYVMALHESGSSAGHVRLMAAVENGVPVVASDVRALAGYVEPGRTAVLVPPGDAAELRAAIDALLGDADRRRSLREEALAKAREWTYERYFEALRMMIAEALEKRG